MSTNEKSTNLESSKVVLPQLIGLNCDNPSKMMNDQYLANILSIIRYSKLTDLDSINDPDQTDSHDKIRSSLLEVKVSSRLVQSCIDSMRELISAYDTLTNDGSAKSTLSRIAFDKLRRNHIFNYDTHDSHGTTDKSALKVAITDLVRVLVYLDMYQVFDITADRFRIYHFLVSESADDKSFIPKQLDYMHRLYYLWLKKQIEQIENDVVGK